MNQDERGVEKWHYDLVKEWGTINRYAVSLRSYFNPNIGPMRPGERRYWSAIQGAKFITYSDIYRERLTNGNAILCDLFGQFNLDSMIRGELPTRYANFCVYSNMLIARSNYQRKNGNNLDNPAWPFPNDGTFNVARVSKFEWRMEYIAGMNDCAWMKVKAKNYNARIYHEKLESKKEEKNRHDSALNAITNTAGDRSHHTIQNHMLQSLHQVLIKTYQSESGIQLMFYPDVRFMLSDLYVNLQVVTRRVSLVPKIPVSDSDTLEGAHLRERHLHRYEDIIATKKEAIQLEDLLQERDKQRKRKIIIEGRAGVGKSTLCKRIAYCWSHPKPANQLWRDNYDWVFWIRLRNLNADNYPIPQEDQTQKKTLDYISEMVIHECFDDGIYDEDEVGALKQLVNDALRKKQSRTLWLLDGYDELNLAQSKNKHLVPVWKLLQKAPHVIITSRPHVYQLTLADELSLEVTGFTNELIDKYLKQYTNTLLDANQCRIETGQQASEILNTLLSNRQDIKSMAYVPINLELLCSIVFQRVDHSNQDANAMAATFDNVSLTELYAELVKSLYERRYKRELRAQGIEEESIVDDLPSDILENHYGKLTRFLECLAYEGMIEKQINLDSAFFDRAYQRYKVVSPYPLLSTEVKKKLKEIGVVNPLRDGTKRGYEFLHLTFQEWFAARFIARVLSDDWGKAKISRVLQENKSAIKKFIQVNKYLPYYAVQMPFVAGILAQRDAKDARGLNDFFELLQTPPMSFLPSHAIELLMLCFEAAQLSERIKHKRRQRILKSIQRYLVSKFSTKNMVRYYYGESCDYCVLPKVLKSVGLTDILVKYLSARDEEVMSGAAFILGQLGVKDKVVISGLKAGLSNSSEILCYNAATALSKLGVRNKTIINSLVSLLLDEAFSRESLFVLSAAPGLVDDQIKATLIEDLMSKLDDKDESTYSSRCAAVAALGRLGVKNERIIDGLTACLSDNHFLVKRNAATALGNLGVLDKAALVALEGLLLDKDKGVRVHAARALGLLGAVRDNAVITGLVGLLRLLDKDAWLVRHSAAMALGQLGEQDKVIINGLKERLSDEHQKVRSAAASALGQLRVKNKGVIAALVEKLLDEHEGVRADALRALKQLSVDRLDLLDLLNKYNIDLLTVFELISLRDAFNLYFKEARSEFLEPLCKRLVANNVLVYVHYNSLYYMDSGVMIPINVFTDPARQKRLKTFLECLRDRVGLVLNDKSYARDYFDRHITPALFNKPRDSSSQSQENEVKHTNQSIQRAESLPIRQKQSLPLSVSHSDPALFLNPFKIKQKVQNDVIYFQLKFDYTTLDEQLVKSLQKVLSKKLGLQSENCFDYKQDKAGRLISLSFIKESSARQLLNAISSKLSRRMQPQKSSSGHVFHFHGPTQFIQQQHVAQLAAKQVNVTQAQSVQVGDRYELGSSTEVHHSVMDSTTHLVHSNQTAATENGMSTASYEAASYRDSDVDVRVRDAGDLSVGPSIEFTESLSPEQISAHAKTLSDIDARRLKADKDHKIRTLIDKAKTTHVGAKMKINPDAQSCGQRCPSLSQNQQSLYGEASQSQSSTTTQVKRSATEKGKEKFRPVM